MNFLIDSDWLISVFNNRKAFVTQLNGLKPHGLGISIITIAELYDGVEFSKDPAKSLASIQALPQIATIIGVNEGIAEHFGTLRARLRQAGNLIPDLDLLIGCTALHRGLTLCTQNVRHFSRIPGLDLFTI